jgi:hypothetical protein
MIKKKKTSRSKIELWLEKELKRIYPKIKFEFNNRTEVGLELDIYLPEHKIAFELNGPFHYYPIFGRAKLNQQKKRDRTKIISCYEAGIDLYVVDITDQKEVNDETCQLYLDEIIEIIDQKI